MSDAIVPEGWESWNLNCTNTQETCAGVL
jgi:hypothetical protein